MPAILYLERVDVCQRLDFSELPDKMDPSILCRDTNIAMCVPTHYWSSLPFILVLLTLPLL